MRFSLKKHFIYLTGTRRLAAAPTLLGGGAEPSALHRNDVVWAMPTINPHHFEVACHRGHSPRYILSYEKRKNNAPLPQIVGAAARRRVLANDAAVSCVRLMKVFPNRLAKFGQFGTTP